MPTADSRCTALIHACHALGLHAELCTDPMWVRVWDAVAPWAAEEICLGTHGESGWCFWWDLKPRVPVKRLAASPCDVAQAIALVLSPSGARRCTRLGW